MLRWPFRSSAADCRLAAAIFHRAAFHCARAHLPCLWPRAGGWARAAEHCVVYMFGTRVFRRGDVYALSSCATGRDQITLALAWRWRAARHAVVLSTLASVSACWRGGRAHGFGHFGPVVLPPSSRQRYTRSADRCLPCGASAWCAGVLLLRRPASVLDLLLMVTMCAWLFDIALSAMLNAGRFDLGFYAGRLYGLMASTVLLSVLLVENTMLYARLAAAYQEERDKRQQIQAQAAQLVDKNRS